MSFVRVVRLLLVLGSGQNKLPVERVRDNQNRIDVQVVRLKVQQFLKAPEKKPKFVLETTTTAVTAALAAFFWITCTASSSQT